MVFSYQNKPHRRVCSAKRDPLGVPTMENVPDSTRTQAVCHVSSGRDTQMMIRKKRKHLMVSILVTENQTNSK